MLFRIYLTCVSLVLCKSLAVGMLECRWNDILITQVSDMSKGTSPMFFTNKDYTIIITRSEIKLCDPLVVSNLKCTCCCDEKSIDHLKKEMWLMIIVLQLLTVSKPKLISVCVYMPYSHILFIYSSWFNRNTVHFKFIQHQWKFHTHSEPIWFVICEWFIGVVSNLLYFLTMYSFHSHLKCSS